MSEKLNLKTATPQEYSKWLQEQVKRGIKDESELSMYHVRLELRNFDPTTGEKLSVPFLQIYDERNWKNPDVQEYLHVMGYTTEVLFNPNPKKGGKKENLTEADSEDAGTGQNKETEE